MYRYVAIDNGDFTEPNTSAVDERGVRRVPWWRSPRGVEGLVTREGGARYELRAGEHLEQPIPAYAPLAGTLTIEGRAGAGAQVSLNTSSAKVAAAEPSSSGSFTLRAEEASRGAAAVPRFQLDVSAPHDGPSVSFGPVHGTIDLPCPSEAELRAEIVAAIDAIARTWIERGTDDVGPRATSFLAKDFDAVTGATLFVVGGDRGPSTTGFSSFHQALFDALAVEENAGWRAYSERFQAELLELQLHPDTGLPRGWNPTTDAPDDATPVEIALVLDYLIDVAEHGTEAFRARARRAAVKIGDTVLARGLLPDGSCAASYVPRDGTPNPSVSQLRRLDVPLRLVRLSKLTGDPRYAKAAREPLAVLEFAHHWAGTWQSIDPGFDDDLGHYGARAAAAARVSADEVAFLRFAREAWTHYEPIWRDALRFGGNVAADQVRCWRIGVDLAHLDPSLRANMGPLLRMAARTHFKGQQYGNGAWGDVTMFDFRPNDTLQVGDLPGVPSNLLMGLATIYTDEIGLRTDEIRAMFTAVWRSSQREYGRPYGFLLTRVQRAGNNSATGSQRVLPALVEMLRALSTPRTAPPK